MTQTVGEAIQDRYITLVKECQALIGKSVMPVEVDSTDITMLVLQYFRDAYDEGGNYKPMLYVLGGLQGIKQPEIDTCYDKIKQFLDWTIATLREKTL